LGKEKGVTDFSVTNGQLGTATAWQIVNQRLETEKVPHELHLTLGSGRGPVISAPVRADVHAPQLPGMHLAAP
jgi:hypothetical protein